MKVAGMNERQKKAFFNIKYAANELIGALENDMLGNSKGSEEYETARKYLADHDRLVHAVYDMATGAFYGDGFCGYSGTFKAFIRDINFCGKKWLMERCEERITKEGY